MSNETLGNRIVRIRKSKGMSQIELSKKCNIIYQTLSKYERDLLNPKLDTLKKIAQALEVPIDYFIHVKEVQDSTYMIHDDVFKQAIALYGIGAQLDMCIEEMSELMKEICKFKRGNDNCSCIVEEIADVYIMMRQLEIMLGIEKEDIDQAKEFKIERLEERIKKHGKRNKQ